MGKSTVSRVLNNESGVSQRTRERVQAVMNQHGLSPSRSARAMRGKAISGRHHCYPPGFVVRKSRRSNHAASVL
ncbi:LacI family DNA-binding transcriptional regulator [Escherichia coli]